jgi:hypothetical protein
MKVKDVRPALEEKFEEVPQAAQSATKDGLAKAQQLTDAPDVKDRFRLGDDGVKRPFGQ